MIHIFLSLSVKLFIHNQDLYKSIAYSYFCQFLNGNNTIF